MKKNILAILLIISTLPIFAQKEYTRQDTLRGKLTPLRTCYDVTYYDLNLRVEPDKQFISGYNSIHYKTTADFDKIQIDLFENMKIEKIIHQNQELKFEREGNATFIRFNSPQTKGKKDFITIHYSGKPRPAINAPWDGGFSWKKDRNNNTWIGVSCEGLGASVWWPNKDHLSEEPDSMRISCEVPTGLTCIANGNLLKTSDLADKFTRYEWKVSYPINNYNVTLNIGKYAHFSETYTAQDGEKMPLDYYVLDYNLNKAKKQFEQVKPMLACYEKLFGKYPFWKDGFALVETPYLGMEHQGAIAYGNGYKNGYLGNDISGSGEGMAFDYIIIHETGHEYWGNSVSCKDHAEMWIHESWCTYTEALYLECMYGREKADSYLAGYMNNIYNTQAILGPMEVNGDGSSDMYFKGAVMLHTLRNVIDNDKLWFEIVKGIATDFKIKHTDTQELVNYISQKAGQDFKYFFTQYLAHTSPPALLYKTDGKTLEYKWKADVKEFRMPIQIQVGKDKYQLLKPTTEWQKINLSLPNDELKLKEKSYYVFLEKQ